MEGLTFGPIYQSNIKLAPPGISAVDHFVRFSYRKDAAAALIKDAPYEKRTLNIPCLSLERCSRVEKGVLGWD
jgi:hypothetical protein